MRVKITLACTECKQRNYDTMKNKKNNPDRLEMNKYCRFCRKHTLHKETKWLKARDIMARKEKQVDSTKKAAAADVKSKKMNVFRRIFNYFKELRNELRRVVWASKKKVFSATLVVMITVVIVGLFVVASDFIFHSLLKLLLGSLW